ncbi:hypothetical protein JL105_08805 [Keratinibaculum paraultunense]|uniref:hypothetical protein n=1 Tax=Keratinibaculum paraultunense TaxID=1278232 RepID=UPI001042A66F|nr:hypothetical protein JL105_08805 [Keratinibaculum paraultunense]
MGNIAAKEIENGDTIILDSGTTTWHVPKYIEAKDITIKVILDAVEGVLLYGVAIVVGAIVTAFMLGNLKKPIESK